MTPSCNFSCRYVIVTPEQSYAFKVIQTAMIKQGLSLYHCKRDSPLILNKSYALQKELIYIVAQTASLLKFTTLENVELK